MAAKTVGALARRDDHPDATALAADGRVDPYREVRATARRVGNFLHYAGVREGSEVAVADVRAPQTVLAFLGAALLGAPCRFVQRGRVDARALVAPTADLSDFEAAADCARVGYGAEPTAPDAAYFERDVWSENSAFPPTPVDPAAPALLAEGAAHSHAALREAADAVADRLAPGEVVALRSPLAGPGAVVAGLLAPLSIGATILLNGDDVGDVAVTDDAAPEPRTLDPEKVGIFSI